MHSGLSGRHPSEGATAMSKTKRSPRSPSLGACASGASALAFPVLDDLLPRPLPPSPAVPRPPNARRTKVSTSPAYPADYLSRNTASAPAINDASRRRRDRLDASPRPISPSPALPSPSIHQENHPIPPHQPLQQSRIRLRRQCGPYRQRERARTGPRHRVAPPSELVPQAGRALLFAALA